MIRLSRTRRTGVAVGVLIGAFALAGCGAGQITQTSTQVSAVSGGSGNVGVIALREAQFEYVAGKESGSVYPRGASAPLRISVINSGSQPDKLVSASSPVAGSVRISGNAEIPGGRSLLVDGEPAAQAASGEAAPAGATNSAEAAPTSESTPTSEAAPTSEDTPTSESAPTAPAAPGSAPDAAATGAQVVLVGINQDIRLGLTYPVTFTFQRAGSLTLNVPVGNPLTPRTASAEE